MRVELPDITGGRAFFVIMHSLLVQLVNSAHFTIIGLTVSVVTLQILAKNWMKYRT